MFKGSCRVKDCDRKLHSPDLCATHERRMQRREPMDAPIRKYTRKVDRDGKAVRRST